MPVWHVFVPPPPASPIVAATSTIEQIVEQPIQVPTSTPPVTIIVLPPTPKPVPAPVPVPPPISPPPVVPPVVPPATTTEDITIGSTTLAVGDVPLLTGGISHAGQTISVSFLQITNIGKEYALLNGFWLTQYGSAATSVIIGLSTVDDKGGSRGLTGGIEGAVPFQNGQAFAPTSALFAPGQMRLFTVKAILSANVAPYLGTELKLDVTGVDSSASIRGVFPIRGTTWTIGP